MKSKILALFLGFAIGLTLVADAQRTGGFPSRPRFQQVKIAQAGTPTTTATIELEARSTGPDLALFETDAAAGDRAWSISASGGNLGIYAWDDTYGALGNALLISRVGATPADITFNTRTIHASAAVSQAALFSSTHANGPYISFSRSGTPFGDIGNGPQISSGASLDDFAIGTRGTGDFVVATGATATERFRVNDAGDSLFTTEVVQQNGSNPSYRLNDADAAADNRLWLMQATGEQFLGRACTDAVSCAQWITVDRTGSTIDAVDITGTAVRANGNGIQTALFARKTADTTRASTTVAADDPHLTVTLASGVTYQLDALIIADSASAVPDLKMQFTRPTNTDSFASFTTIEAAVGLITTSSLAGNFSAIHVIPLTVNNDHHIRITGMITTTAAGTFAISWAQNTSDATATRLLAGSWIKLTRVLN